MPRNIMAALNTVPNGKAPKNPFDLMSYETFHQKGGQLNVVGIRETVPNSDYRMSVDGFTRSDLCNTANFARMKENYYFVHVPLGLISGNAYQMLVQRKQPYSARDFGITQFPYFSLKAVLKRCIEVAHLDLTLDANAKWKDVHGYNIGLGAFKLLDMLGYGCYLDIVESTFKSENALTVDQAKSIFDTIPYSPNALAIGAYQMIWFYFFRNEIYDNNVTAKIFNFDDITSAAPGQEPLSNYNILSIRDLDDFIIDCLQLRYVPYKNDVFMGAMPGTQFGAVSTVPVDISFTDLTASFTGTAVTPTATFNGSNEGVTGSVSSVFTGDTSHVDVSGTTGIDGLHQFLDSQSSEPVDISSSSSLNYLPTYHVADGHVFGSQLVSSSPRMPIPNVQVEVQGSFSQIQNDGHNIVDKHKHGFIGEGSTIANGTVASTFSGSFTPHGSVTINPITPSGTVDLSGGAASSSLFDVLSLVEAQAIQKWRQKSMLAGNKTADQFRAHHGEVPRHLIDHIPDFIGSVDNPIQITEITSQSDTAADADESNLGEIRGRGYGASDNKVFSFHSDDYGLLFLLHAIVPENTYSSFGLDKRNTKLYYTDFYQEEYMNIGLESVPNYLLNVTDLLGNTPADPHGTGSETFPVSGVGIRGYAPRYFEYKQYPSKVHGMFNPSRLTIYDVEHADLFGYSDMQSFVMPRADLIVPLSNELSFNWLVWTLSKLYVNPAIFDSIFAENADSHELTDNFFSHIKFNCQSLLPISVLGLPQF